MELDFQRAMLVIIGVFGTITVIATIGLFFAFRAFGAAKPGSRRHLVILALVVVFIFAVCLALFVWSLAAPE